MVLGLAAVAAAASPSVAMPLSASINRFLKVGELRNRLHFMVSSSASCRSSRDETGGVYALEASYNALEGLEFEAVEDVEEDGFTNRKTNDFSYEEDQNRTDEENQSFEAEQVRNTQDFDEEESNDDEDEEEESEFDDEEVDDDEESEGSLDEYDESGTGTDVDEHEEEDDEDDEQNEGKIRNQSAKTDGGEVSSRIDRPFALPLVTGGRGPYPGPNRVDPRRRRGGLGQPVHRMLILKPPMSDKKLAQRILASPQLRLKTLPVLSSLLPIAPFREIDKEWINENMVELKDVLGYSKLGKDNDEKEVDDDEQFWQHGNPDPKAHLDTFLYLAFQHEESFRAKRMKHTRVGHLRLAFLGEFVLDLALAELLLQVYPRETPGSLRERAFAVTNKRGLENVLAEASLYQLAFPEEEAFREKYPKRCMLCKSVFMALVAAVYLSLGMAEVYKLLFETFGFDLDAKSAQPRVRTKHEDVDKLSADFDGRKLTWKDIAFYKPPADALFAAPRLFRACVPLGMYRFRRNLWDVETLPQVMKILGYPLDVNQESETMSEARNLELGLGLQLCFMHPSMYKGEHPRFCNERLEYIGSKIQDVIMAERLLMKHLDAPALFLRRNHRILTINRICGRRLRIKRLHKFIEYGEERLQEFNRNKRLKTFTHSAAQQAIHGLGYVVYGKGEVRRLMFDVFEAEQPLPTQADFNDMLASQGRHYVNTLQPTY